jgi:hypothetical protein
MKMCGSAATSGGADADPPVRTWRSIEPPSTEIPMS